MRIVLLMGLVFAAIGCHSTSTRRVESRERSVPLQREAATADDFIAAIQAAHTAAAEADAIRKLRQWEVNNGLTYTIHTFRTYDNALVDGASVGNQPVRAQVTIFRGCEVVRTFTFIPKDNRNLALFGE